MANNKARAQEIYTAAAYVVEVAGGANRIDDIMDPVHRAALYRQMYKDTVAATGCSISAAKSNVAKAMRKGRYAEMVKVDWGGPRPNAGRPKSQD